MHDAPTILNGDLYCLMADTNLLNVSAAVRLYLDSNIAIDFLELADFFLFNFFDILIFFSPLIFLRAQALH